MDGGDRGGRSEVMEKETVRIAAIADIHVKKTSQGAFQPIFARATAEADVLLLCGDLTDYGAIEEAKILAKVEFAPDALCLGKGDRAAVNRRKLARACLVEEVIAAVKPREGDDHEQRDRDHERLLKSAKKMDHGQGSFGVAFTQTHY